MISKIRVEKALGNGALERAIEVELSGDVSNKEALDIIDELLTALPQRTNSDGERKDLAGRHLEETFLEEGVTSDFRISSTFEPLNITDTPNMALTCLCGKLNHSCNRVSLKEDVI